MFVQPPAQPTRPSGGRRYIQEVPTQRHRSDFYSDTHRVPSCREASYCLSDRQYQLFSRFHDSDSDFHRVPSRREASYSVPDRQYQYQSSSRFYGLNNDGDLHQTPSRYVVSGHPLSQNSYPYQPASHSYSLDNLATERRQSYSRSSGSPQGPPPKRRQRSRQVSDAPPAIKLSHQERQPADVPSAPAIIKLSHHGRQAVQESSTTPSAQAVHAPPPRESLRVPIPSLCHSDGSLSPESLPKRPRPSPNHYAEPAFLYYSDEHPSSPDPVTSDFEDDEGSDIDVQSNNDITAQDPCRAPCSSGKKEHRVLMAPSPFVPVVKIKTAAARLQETALDLVGPQTNETPIYRCPSPAHGMSSPLGSTLSDLHDHAVQNYICRYFLMQKGNRVLTTR